MIRLSSVVLFFAGLVLAVAVVLVQGAAAAAPHEHKQHPRIRAKKLEMHAAFHKLRAKFLRDDGTFKHDHEPAAPSPSASYLRGIAAHSNNNHYRAGAAVPTMTMAPSGPSSHNNSKHHGFGVNVMDFGAVPDGKTDNTAAFQAAIHAGKGGRIVVPSGSYVFDTSSQASITVPPGTELVGENAGPFRVWNEGGTTLIVRGTPKGPNPFVFLNGPDAGIIGLSIFYASQVAGTVTVPIAYGPAIQGQGDNLLVENIFLANPYFGIDFASFPCGRHFINGVYGQPLFMGIAIDRVYDIGRQQLIHFWPFTYGYTPANQKGIFQFIMTKATTIKIMRTDWFELLDAFSWGYNIGIHFAVSPHSETPKTPNGQISLLNFDDVHHGIFIEGTQPPGIQISDYNVANAGNQADSSAAIFCQPNATADTQIVVRGLSAWGQFSKIVDWNCGGKVSVSQFVISSWSRSQCAFDIRGGRAMIQSGYFHDVIGCGVHVAESADRAIVTGNDLVGNSAKCVGSNRLCSGNLP